MHLCVGRLVGGILVESLLGCFVELLSTVLSRGGAESTSSHRRNNSDWVDQTRDHE